MEEFGYGFRVLAGVRWGGPKTLKPKPDSSTGYCMRAYDAQKSGTDICLKLLGGSWVVISGLYK